MSIVLSMKKLFDRFTGGEKRRIRAKAMKWRRDTRARKERHRREAGIPDGVELLPNGSIADPVEFRLWSIKRSADAQAERMYITGKTAVLLPEIGQLDSHLRKLEIRHTEISDISALSNLPSLEELKITASPISDFSVLGSLKNLKRLEISYTSDATVDIPDLPDLRVIKISNPHGNISLGKLTELEQAEFQAINTLSEVARQPRLTELKFQRQGDDSLNALQHATNLRKLDVRLHGEMDLSPLAALKELDHLRLVAPDISDLSPLSALTQLTKLQIYDCKASDATFLSGFTKLMSLALRYQHPLDDLSFLAGMDDLSDLGICPSKTADLEIIADLPILQDLRLIQIDPNTPLSPLSSCMDLKHLFISTNASVPDRDIQAMPSPPQITNLGLSWKGLRSLKGLEKCTFLQRLSCSYTSIESLQPLVGMKHLTQLHVVGSEVSDLSVLATLPCFVTEKSEIRISLRDTPAAKRYPDLAKTISMETGRDGDLYQHDTAVKAVRIVTRST